MNYVFFIGGSGARAYTAFLHACAAGVIKTDAVKVILLDADADNAACQKSCDLYQAYIDHRRMIYDRKHTAAAFHCDVQMYQSKAISPVPEDIPHLQQVAAGNKDRERALRWFYTEDELSQSLDKGFYAHPNIGCMFFQNFGSNTYLKKCMEELAKDMRRGKEPRVVIVGSVFGGTGAAGVPSVLKMLEETCCSQQNAVLHYGGVLVTPYFKVAEAPTERGLTIDSDKFYGSTKAALNYYWFIDKFEKTYLVGQKTLDIVNDRYVDGGADQDNKPHIVEMAAAMAVKDFLEERGEDREILGQFFDWNNDDRQSTWDFFVEDIYQLADMLRAQMVLETAIYPCANMQGVGWLGSSYQWRQVYCADTATGQKQLAIMQRYSRLFFEWLYGLQCEYTETPGILPHVELCDSEILSELWSRVKARVENDAESLPEYKTKGWRKYQQDFINLVETAEGIEYVVEKVGVLLSALGVLSKSAGILNCAVLFLKLFRLVEHISTKPEG